MFGILKASLVEVLEQKFATAVGREVEAGVPPVDPEYADDLLLKVAQLPHDRVRGLIVIAAIDIADPIKGPGVDVQVYAAGTNYTLDPLMDLGVQQIDEKLRNPDGAGEVCPGCGQVHDEVGTDGLGVGDLTARLLSMLGAGGSRRSH